MTSKSGAEFSDAAMGTPDDVPALAGSEAPIIGL